MALNVLLGRAWRAAARASARGAGSLADGGGGCGSRGVPACPPCVPAPQPPCRAGEPPGLRGTRVVCCPPPQGARPPCPRPAPACSLSCRDAVREERVSSSQASLPHARPSRNEQRGCGCNQDPVALRLQRARCARQADYEREVASRNAAPPAPPPCPAPYALAGERECARATDGCTYAVLHASPPGPAGPPAPSPPAPGRCGPGRTPPPPRCVELAPDDACRIKGDGRLDPCAHRPRVMIEIDRSASTPSSTPAQKSSDSCTNTESNQAAPAMPQSCTSGSGSARSGHPKWCANPPQPASVPPRCRRLTIVERLRARPPSSQSERRTHTSVALSKAGKCERSVSGGLDGMLRLKEQLKEAGLGRVVTDTEAGRAPQSIPPGGRLELCVPPGTERVAVHVSLMRKPVSPCPALASTSDSCAPASCAPVSCAPASCAPASCAPASCAPASCAPASCATASCSTACVPTSSISCATSTFDANSRRRDPWLSIKNIQKKLSGRCDQGLVDHKANALSVDAGCDCAKPRARCSSSEPAPTSPPASIPSRCKPPALIRCARPPNGSKTENKRCSSTSAFFANTIIVNS